MNGPANGPEAITPRIAVVMPYWHFFEVVSGIDLRADRERLLADAARTLSHHGVVVVADVLEGADGVVAARESVEKARPDVLLLLLTMAAPPSAVGLLLAALPALSVVVWSCERSAPGGGSEGPSGAVTEAEIVQRGTSVGTPMVTSDLVSAGRPFALVLGDPAAAATHDQLAGALRPAAVATRVRRARVGRLGEPMPGYTSVDDTDDNLHRSLGLEVVRLPASALGSVTNDTTGPEVEAWMSTQGAAYDWPEETTDGIPQAIRAAVALQTLLRRHGLDAGSLSCHAPEVRGSNAVGVAPCLALGSATSAGCPWTCTGDILTSIAMLVGSLLTGTSWYHEIETHDQISDRWVLANSGEHDLRWAQGRAVVRPSPWWPGSVNARHDLAVGPCTLIAIRRTRDGHRLVAAEADITGDERLHTGATSAWLRFRGAPGPDVWRAWVLAGAGHHSCLVRGHVAGELLKIAEHLLIEGVCVTSRPVST